MALYPKKGTSRLGKGHKIHHYFLKGLSIDRPNQAFCTDIICIPLANGLVYLVAIMDWHSRKILSCRLSNTMATDFCIDALEEAINRYGASEIFNTDQGAQFTIDAFTGILKLAKVKISMDGKGRWVDNVMIKRFGPSLKYEEVYLRAYDSVNEARVSIREYIGLKCRTKAPVSKENARLGLFWNKSVA